MTKVPMTPEETVESLARSVREGKLSRQGLLRELIKLGLEEQKRWKAIHYVRTGRVDMTKGAEIAGLDIDGFQTLLAR